MHLPRVLITRAPQQGSALAELLRAQGIEPVLIPAIEITPPSSFDSLDAALHQLNTFHWLLFTSANAVEAFAQRSAGATQSRAPQETAGASKIRVPHLREAKVGEAPQTPQRPRIAAIGPATANALELLGLTPDLIPPLAIAESLAEALLPHARQPDGTPTRFLLIRAEEAREHLPNALRAAGAELTIAPAYRTVIPPGSIHLIQSLFAPAPKPSQSTVILSAAKDLGIRQARAEGASPSQAPAPIDAITFTSSSTARNLLALCEAAQVTLPESALRLSIGPITTQTLRDLGLPPHAEAAQATIASLAETVRDALQNRR